MHEKFMRRAIQLSKRGFPAPNPHVGCVIVRDGQVVGEGYHHYWGGLHAEREALKFAKGLSVGADAYVTLEPCAHHGRTPPCVDGLLEAGIKRVFVACPDPNPVAAGGAEKLRAAGVEVQVGILEEEARAANQQFLFAMEHKRPYVVAKAAMTLDGRIALPSGESKWITGEQARRVGHRLRAECGAVLVGYRTVLADDPELTARIPGVRNQPVRIVLDPHSKLSGAERVFNEQARTIHVTGEILLPNLLSRLFQEGIRGLLVEGGGRTLSYFFKEDLVDSLELFAAGKLFGAGPSWIEGGLAETIADAPRLEITRVRKLGQDLQLTAKIDRSCKR